jgi:hypothetical protein
MKVLLKTKSLITGLGWMIVHPNEGIIKDKVFNNRIKIFKGLKKI